VPAAAETDLEAAAAQVIEGRGGLRQQRRVAIADVEDQAAEAVSKWGRVPPAGGASYMWSQTDSQSMPAASSRRQRARSSAMLMLCGPM
jgi:hypothetical protein